MFRQKGVGGLGAVKVVVGIILLATVLFLDRIWDFLRSQGDFLLENDGLANLGDKFLLLIVIGVFFILLEVNEIKRNLKK